MRLVALVLLLLLPAGLYATQLSSHEPDFMQQRPPLSGWLLLGGGFHADPEVEVDYLTGVGIGVITERLSVGVNVFGHTPFKTDSSTAEVGNTSAEAFLNALANSHAYTLEMSGEWVVYASEAPDGPPVSESIFLIPPKTRTEGVYLRAETAWHFEDGRTDHDLTSAIGGFYTTSNGSVRGELGARQKERLFRDFGSDNRFWPFIRVRFDSPALVELGKFGSAGVFFNALFDLAGLSVLDESAEECAARSPLDPCQQVEVGKEIIIGGGVRLAWPPSESSGSD